MELQTSKWSLPSILSRPLKRSAYSERISSSVKMLISCSSVGWLMSEVTLLKCEMFCHWTTTRSIFFATSAPSIGVSQYLLLHETLQDNPCCFRGFTPTLWHFLAHSVLTLSMWQVPTLFSWFWSQLTSIDGVGHYRMLLCPPASILFCFQISMVTLIIWFLVLPTELTWLGKDKTQSSSSDAGDGSACNSFTFRLLLCMVLRDGAFCVAMFSADRQN